MSLKLAGLMVHRMGKPRSFATLESAKVSCLPAEVVQEMEQWLKSEGGRAALEQAEKEARSEIQRLQKGRMVTWEQLNTPIGPLRT